MKKYIILLILQCCTHLVFAQYPSLYWAKSFGGNSQFMSGQSMAVDASGNVYVAGIFSGDCDFDPSINQFSVYSKDGGKDVFVSKFNSSGQLIWAKTVGGIYDESVCGVAVDVSGNVYLAGQLGYAGDYDPGPAVLTLTSAGGGPPPDRGHPSQYQKRVAVTLVYQPIAFVRYQLACASDPPGAAKRGMLRQPGGCLAE